MNTLSYIANFLLPILSLVFLLIGIGIKRGNYVLIALWLSLIALLYQYQTAGGEILGTYFTYINAGIYTLDLIVLIVSLLYFFLNAPIFKGKYASYITGLFSACLIIGGVILAINLWVNACFIENRLSGTAIMQVVSNTPPDYCSYRYVFYKVGINGQISYLCPNYYGLIPKVGHIEVAPEFLARQLSHHPLIKGKKVDN